MPVQPDRDRIYETIRQRVESGEWPPGHRLPSTRELAVEFGVSSGTVEVATNWLLREGWIVSHVGKGRFVADSPPSG